MNQQTQKPWARISVLVLFVSALLGLALFSATAARAESTGNGTGDELLVYNRGSNANPFAVTKQLGGFIVDRPPTGASNANWVSGQYAGFAGGTVYVRARIVSIPKSHPGMRFGFCFWQGSRENCKGMTISGGAAGSEQTMTFALNKMWKKNGQQIDWSKPRAKAGFSVRTRNNRPVSDKGGFNWSGENPNDWYTMKVHYTVVLVKAGGTFDGWQNYGW
jgi:hypothetical protein